MYRTCFHTRPGTGAGCTGVAQARVTWLPHHLARGVQGQIENTPSHQYRTGGTFPFCRTVNSSLEQRESKDGLKRTVKGFPCLHLAEPSNHERAQSDNHTHTATFKTVSLPWHGPESLFDRLQYLQRGKEKRNNERKEKKEETTTYSVPMSIVFTDRVTDFWIFAELSYPKGRTLQGHSHNPSL
jgi:hypothetical protein